MVEAALDMSWIGPQQAACAGTMWSLKLEANVMCLLIIIIHSDILSNY